VAAPENDHLESMNLHVARVEVDTSYQ